MQKSLIQPDILGDFSPLSMYYSHSFILGR